MEYPNKSETQENILKPLSNQAKQQNLDQKILLQYEHLSYFEKEEITKWIKKNLSKIPMLSKNKKIGLGRLLVNDYEFPAALEMIRHAIRTLHISIKEKTTT